MRVTADAKQQTRERIVETARRLFAGNGFDSTTTRDITISAQIAAGTLFNYFPNKEALAMSIMAESLTEAKDDFWRRRSGNESLAEDLFANVMAGLRRLASSRHYLGEVIEKALSPFA